MAFKDRNTIPDLSGLLITLQQSKIIQSNPALFQTINELIKRVDTTQNDILNQISGLNVSITNITALLTETFLTATDETATLVNSRQLLAGTNITFDDSVAGERTVNASGGGVSADYVVTSDGATPTPSPIDDGFGNFIYVSYTP